MIRLNREARMARKEIDSQIKKHGKVTDNFICLPDPENCFDWYYVVFGLEAEGFHGGFYFGKVTCPKDYPKHAPNIKIYTENGRFSTQEDGICMSISDMHPESWNPVWKVNQMVVGLISFWLGDAEETYGELYEDDYDCSMSFTDHRIRLAKLSR